MSKVIEIPAIVEKKFDYTKFLRRILIILLIGILVFVFIIYPPLHEFIHNMYLKSVSYCKCEFCGEEFNVDLRFQDAFNIMDEVVVYADEYNHMEEYHHCYHDYKFDYYLFIKFILSIASVVVIFFMVIYNLIKGRKVGKRKHLIISAVLLVISFFVIKYMGSLM